VKWPRRQAKRQPALEPHEISSNALRHLWREGAEGGYGLDAAIGTAAMVPFGSGFAGSEQDA